jgi:hypothetical protein
MSACCPSWPLPWCQLGVRIVGVNNPSWLGRSTFTVTVTGTDPQLVQPLRSTLCAPKGTGCASSAVSQLTRQTRCPPNQPRSPARNTASQQGNELWARAEATQTWNNLIFVVP